jgi:hypothetical protein
METAKQGVSLSGTIARASGAASATDTAGALPSSVTDAILSAFINQTDAASTPPAAAMTPFPHRSDPIRLAYILDWLLSEGR